MIFKAKMHSFGRLFKRKSLSRNTIFSAITSFMIFLSWSVLFIVLGRTLSVKDFGIVGLAMAVGTLLALLPSYGFDLLIIRELVQGTYRHNDIVGNIIIIKLILALVSFVFLQLYINLSASAEQPAVFWLIALSTTVLSFSNFFTAMFKSDEDFHTETLVVTVQALSQLFLITFVAIMWGISAAQASFLILMSNTAGLLIAIWAFWGKSRAAGIPFVLSFNGPMAWHLTKQAFPFAIQNFLGVAYFQSDTIAIGELLNVTSVGYYQAAMRFITGIMRVPMIMINAFYPRIAQSFASKKDEADLSTSRLLIHFMIWIGSLLTIFFFVTAAPLITLLYTEKMTPAIPALQILSFVLVIRFVASGYGIILTSCHRQFTQVVGAAVGVVTNVGLNMLLIPTYGFIAAAWVSVITNAVILLMYAIFVKRALGTFLLKGLVSFGRQILIYLHLH